MKNSKKFTYMFGFVLILLIGTQSCTIFGGFAGAVADIADNTDYETPIEEGEGWIKPAKKNSRLELTLTNDKGDGVNTKAPKLRQSIIHLFKL